MIDKKTLLITAWVLAKAGKKHFGGKVKDFFSEALKIAWTQIKQHQKENKKLYIVALSGGKDSTAMALRLKELYPNREFKYIITPTGDELPEMQIHWKKLEKILGPIQILPGRTLLGRIQEKNMLPNFRARWCTVDLKIEPMIDFLDALPQNSIMYVGLRADEPGRFGLSSLDKKFVVNYPFREWEWGINDVLDYLEDREVSIPARTECGCCFYQKIGEWKNLLDHHPARYEKYVQLEEQIGHTFRSAGRDTWPAALKDLRVEFLSGRKVRPYNMTKKTTQKCRFCSM